MTSPQFRSPSVAVVKSSPGRTVEPLLNIVPISVRSPSTQTAELPSRAFEGEGRKHLSPERDEDSLLTSAELAARGYIVCPTGL